jgi:acetyltransferase-like isoleucine patch superfamily enzyme
MNHQRTWRNLLYTAWDVFWIGLDRKFSTLRSKASLLIQGCPFGKGFASSGHCSYKARRTGSIKLGHSVQLLSGWRSNRVGLSGPVLLQTFGEGTIEIGDHSGGSAIVLSSRSKISIGKHVNLGGNVRVYDHDFHALEPGYRRLGLDEQAVFVRTSPVEIGDDVFVGTNSIILKGVKLGDRSIVAAGSVVFKGDYPADCMLAGNPAKVVGGASRAGKEIPEDESK